LGEKWSFLLNVSNGWQVIRDINTSKALGTQIQFSPNEKITLNSSTFVEDQPIFSGRSLRLFHNFYGDFELSKKIRLIAGFDFGWQDDLLLSVNNQRTWLGQVLIIQYKFSETYAVAARQEYYSDPDGVIIGSDNLQSYSLNFDYSINKKAMLRLEGK